MLSVAGAVLAAGAGRRMGAPKADLVMDGERLVDRAVRVLHDGGCAPVFAVVRSGVVVAGADVVVNPDPERGMRSSLELAIAAAGDADGLLVLLVDMPGVPAADVRAVIATWRPDRVALARYGPRRGGHPVLMAPALWRAAVRSAGPDEGARAYLAVHPELVDAVPGTGDPRDLDAPGDLTAWPEP